MNQVEWLTPLKGLLVRYPVTMEILPEQGAEIPMIGKEGRYWRRRIKDGTVTIGRKPSVKKTKPIKEDKEG